jgi:Mg2+ and Co2+ transporter CorA
VDNEDDRTTGRPRARSCYVIHHQGSGPVEFSTEKISELLAEGGFFWLDLDQPDAADFQILRDVFKFHPLAIEDSEHFGQRSKIDSYDDFAFLVLYGASTDEDRLAGSTASTTSGTSSPSTATMRRRSTRYATASRSGASR